MQDGQDAAELVIVVKAFWQLQNIIYFFRLPAKQKALTTRK
jgi:hypothetical protein